MSWLLGLLPKEKQTEIIDSMSTIDTQFTETKPAVTQLDKVKALTAALEAVVKANDADMNDHCIQERIEERLDIVSEKLVNAINEL